MKQPVEDRTSPARPFCTGVGGTPGRVPVLRSITLSPTEEPHRLVRYDRHHHIFRDADAARRIYQIVEGAVMLYKLLPDGRRQVVELLGPDDVFGLTESQVHDCSAETLSAVVLTVYDRASLESSTELLKAISYRMRSQICALHEHAVLLGRKSALERVATFLISCVPGPSRTGCKALNGVDRAAVVRLRMTRQEIADYLGLTIETVSRAFSELRRRRLVRIEKLDEVQIDDICGICRLTGAH